MDSHSFSSEHSDTIRRTDQEIREYFGQQTETELRMERDGVLFTLIRIAPDDEENIRRFTPYHDENVVGKYGLIWEMGYLRDFYVFDTKEYAVDFIVMSRAVRR